MIERMPAHSLAEFQSNGEKLAGEIKRSHQPLVLTVDGQAELVVQDAASYARMLAQIDELAVLKAIQAGEEDIKAGRVRPAREALAEMGARFGFSSIWSSAECSS